MLSTLLVLMLLMALLVMLLLHLLFYQELLFILLLPPLFAILIFVLLLLHPIGLLTLLVPPTCADTSQSCSRSGCSCCSLWSCPPCFSCCTRDF